MNQAAQLFPLTIERRSIGMWIRCAGQEEFSHQEVMRLYRLARKKADTSGRPLDCARADALWTAACCIRRELEKTVEALRDRGGLLHFGAPKALELARYMHEIAQRAESAYWHATRQTAGGCH